MDSLLPHEGGSRQPLSPKMFFGGVVVCALLSVIGFVLYDQFSGSRGVSNPYEGYACNVLGLNIHGEIVTYIPPESLSSESDGAPLEDVVSSEDIVATIEKVNLQ